MIRNIQAFRALAAYLVVTVHLSVLVAALGVPLVVAQFGACGVDLFFVISGFVIIFISARRKPAPLAFMIDRILRVAPPYWMLTALMAALLSMRFGSFPPASMGQFIKSILFIPYWSVHGYSPVLYVGWTLDYEMAFYLAFALTLIIKNLRSRIIMLSLLFLGLTLVHFIFSPPLGLADFYTSPIMLEFAAGMWIAFAYVRGLRLPAAVAWPLLIFGMLILIVGQPLTQMDRAWACGIPASIIVAAAVSLESHGRIIRSAFIELLGNASYALYLVHPFVAAFMIKLATRLHVAGAFLPTFGVIIATLLFAGIAAVLFHLYVERPIGAWLRRKAGHAPSRIEKSDARMVEAGV